jgi:hypothetical protein
MNLAKSGCVCAVLIGTFVNTYSRLLAESPQLASARVGVARAQATAE